MYLAKFSLDRYWTKGQQDKDNLVAIEFEGEVRLARVSLNTPQAWIPSKQWVTEFRDVFYAVIDRIGSYYDICVVGLALVDGTKSQDPAILSFLKEYSDLRILHLSSAWRFLISDSSSEGERLEITHVDKTSILIDRTKKVIIIDDQVNKTKFTIDERGLTVDTQHDIILNVPQGQHVYVGDESGERIATEKFVDNVYKNHVHPSPAGITGKPVPLGIENKWPQVTDRAIGR